MARLLPDVLLQHEEGLRSKVRTDRMFGSECTRCYVGCSVGKAVPSVLEIKEFVPGRPWGSQQPGTDADSSAAATATTAAGSSQGLGMRCSSLADMEKLVVTSPSRMSTSEWSLDVPVPVSGSSSNGGSKGIVDPAGSLPALWTPLEPSAGTAVPTTKGKNLRMTFYLLFSSFLLSYFHLVLCEFHS